LGARSHAPHSAYARAPLQPAVEDVFCDLARYLKLENTTHTGVVDWILELRDEVGIPHTIDALGVTEEHIAMLAPLAVADPSSGSNPIPLDVANVSELYSRALDGRM
jgi:alcohol dehydrogenase class IV